MPNNSIVAIVHIIHDKIMTILNRFADEKAIFKNYPQLVAKPLSTLAVLIAIFNPIQKEFAPSIESAVYLSCRLQDILVEYRFLNICYRLKEVGFYKIRPDILYDKASEVIGWNYNRYGYNNNKTTIECNQCECSFSQCMTALTPCLQDHYSNQCFKGNSPMSSNCPPEYMGAMRYNIEKSFGKMIDQLNDVCPAHIRAQRKLTGMN